MSNLSPFESAQLDSLSVAVIMSVKNGAKYLRSSIDSILNQSFRNFKFYIYDDASTDATPSILRSYALIDQRVIPVSGDCHGLPSVLNHLIDQTNADFIARMDADDISAPHRFLKQLTLLHDNPDISLCGCQINFINEKSDIFGSKSLPLLHDEIAHMLKYQSPIYHPAFMIRTSALRHLRHPLYHPLFIYGQDYELLTYLVKSGVRLANHHEYLLQYRVTSSKLNLHKIIRQARLTRLCLLSARHESHDGIPSLDNYFPSILSIGFVDIIAFRLLLRTYGPTSSLNKPLKAFLLIIASLLSTDVSFLVLRDFCAYSLPRLHNTRLKSILTRVTALLLEH